MAAAPPPTSGVRTVAVVRTDVAAREQVGGTLGYAGQRQIVHPGPPGVLTAAPAPGTVVERGQSLYEVDGHPVRLLYGARPAWRALDTGVQSGRVWATARGTGPTSSPAASGNGWP